MVLKHNLSEAEKLAETIRESINELQNTKDAPFKCIISEAEQQAETLVDTINKAIVAMQNKDEKLIEFLNWFNPRAIIVYAGALAYQRKMDRAKSEIKKIKSVENLDYRSRYDLACYYSVAGERNKIERDENYKNALDHLEYALEIGGNIVQMAQNDLSLKGVREDGTRKAEFNEIIKKYGAPVLETSDLPLAGLVIIRENYAKQLKEQGIVSHCDLILKADTPSAREALAEKLGISTTLLRRWALLADLMHIVENTKYVNLLEAADAGSLDALKTVSDPCELANLLNQVNKAQSLVKQLPSMGTVQQWVQDAKKTKPRVL